MMACGEEIGEPPFMLTVHTNTCSSEPTLRILWPRRTWRWTWVSLSVIPARTRRAAAIVQRPEELC